MKHLRFIGHLSFFLLASLLMATLPARALVGKTYTMQHGLQGTEIKSLYFDNRGFLWTCTEESLEMFDGSRFHKVNCTDPATGRTLFYYVTWIRQIDDDEYIVTTNTGTYIYNCHDGSFTRTKLDSAEGNLGYNVTQIVACPDGKKLLMGTDGKGVFVFDTKTKKTNAAMSRRINRLMTNRYCKALLIDSKNGLWVNDGNHRLFCVDLSTYTLRTFSASTEALAALKSSTVSCMAESPVAGKIFFGLSNGGILVYDESTNKLRTSRESATRLYVYTMLLSKSGQLLIGTDNYGLWTMDPATESLHPESIHTDVFEMSTAKVHALAEDADGNIVVGLYQRGIAVLPIETRGFHYIAFPLPGGWKNASCVSSVVPGDDGTLWAATDGSGVYRRDKQGNMTQLTSGLNSRLTQALAVDKHGTVWCGSWHGGLQRLDGQRFVTPPILAAMSHYNVMFLDYDRERDRLYIGTNGNGLWTLDIATKTLKQIPNYRIQMRWMNALRLDSEGRLWFSDAAFNYRYDPVTERVSSFADTDKGRIYTATCIAEMGKYMLLGTNYGIVKVNKQTLERTPDKLLEPSTAYNVKSMEVSRNGVWYTAGNQLYYIDMKNGRQLRFNAGGSHYLGMFHPATSAMNADGTMIFGCDNGAVAFRPEEVLSMEKRLHPLYVTQLKVANQEVDYVASLGRGNRLDAAVTQATKLKLHRGESSFAVEFCMPEMGEPERVVYTYTLKGHDDEWHTTGPGVGTAIYSGLRPGKYTLIMRAKYDNGDVNDDGKYTERKLTVKVPYPLYLSWWAILLYIVIIAGASYINYYNIRERHRAKEELTEAMEKDAGYKFSSTKVDSYEERLMKKTNEVIMKHIDDTNLTVKQLCDEVGVGRAALNRKLREVYGVPAATYIRNVRLKHAAFLLVNNKVNISEVAYHVGFSSHSYFTSKFREYFGKTPSEFITAYSGHLDDETLKRLLE
jgi:AraC-like DNA-binding protein/ligand-binding sensor domain-containing protein